MLSLESQSILAWFFKIIAQFEIKVEEHRQALTKNQHFNPQTCFDYLDEMKIGELNCRQLCKHIPNSTEFETQMIIRQYSSGKTTALSYNDFQNLVLPSTNMGLKQTALSRNYQPTLPNEVKHLLIALLQQEVQAQRLISEVKGILTASSEFSATDAFRILDIPATGFITRGKLVQFLKQHSVEVSEEEIDAILRRCDTDDDEMLGYKEFAEAVIVYSRNRYNGEGKCRGLDDVMEMSGRLQAGFSKMDKMVQNGDRKQTYRSNKREMHYESLQSSYKASPEKKQETRELLLLDQKENFDYHSYKVESLQEVYTINEPRKLAERKDWNHGNAQNMTHQRPPIRQQSVNSSFDTKRTRKSSLVKFALNSSMEQQTNRSFHVSSNQEMPKVMTRYQNRPIYSYKYYQNYPKTQKFAINSSTNTITTERPPRAAFKVQNLDLNDQSIQQSETHAKDSQTPMFKKQYSNSTDRNVKSPQISTEVYSEREKHREQPRISNFKSSYVFHFDQLPHTYSDLRERRTPEGLQNSRRINSGERDKTYTNNQYNMAEYLDKALETFENLPKPLLYSISAIGALKVASKLYRLSSFLHKHLIRGRLNHLKRYGYGSWALITGGGDGIGEEYCYQLAKLGFNIIVVGRSDNIIKVSENVTQNFKVSSFYIKTDLSNYIQAVQELAHKTQGLDISILVNNAGIAIKEDYFDQVEAGNINRLMSINAVSPVMVTRQFIPQLLQRKQKSAVIFVSSMTGIYTFPFISTYSGTKAHIRAFAQALSEEYRGKLDVLAHCPALVSTKMTNRMKGWGVVTPEDTVSGALDALGRDNAAVGTFKHDAIWSMFNEMYGNEGVTRKVNYPVLKRIVEGRRS